MNLLLSVFYTFNILIPLLVLVICPFLIKKYFKNLSPTKINLYYSAFISLLLLLIFIAIPFKSEVALQTLVMEWIIFAGLIFLILTVLDKFKLVSIYDKKRLFFWFGISLVMLLFKWYYFVGIHHGTISYYVGAFEVPYSLFLPMQIIASICLLAFFILALFNNKIIISFTGFIILLVITLLINSLQIVSLIVN